MAQAVPVQVRPWAPNKKALHVSEGPFFVVAGRALCIKVGLVSGVV